MADAFDSTDLNFCPSCGRFPSAADEEHIVSHLSAVLSLLQDRRRLDPARLSLSPQVCPVVVLLAPPGAGQPKAGSTRSVRPAPEIIWAALALPSLSRHIIPPP
ncbi:unnamed protein product [Linum tenue]|uniref:Uncharacterized protein n=1 Tax=Linum tenue TaxID=586396 RepID=A0AAV0GTK5_9ROSI|nr:unnamed protein product [Linum tenue]